MRKAKTHFEQVPLEVVKAIAEEQIWQEATIDEDQEPGKKDYSEKGCGDRETIQSRGRPILPRGSEQGSS